MYIRGGNPQVPNFFLSSSFNHLSFIIIVSRTSSALARMKYSLIGAVLGVFAVQALALPSYPYISHVVHEKRGALQSRWARGNPVDPDHVLPVRIGLKQRNLARGMDYLLEVYVLPNSASTRLS
jgi:hypothetical protein